MRDVMSANEVDDCKEKTEKCKIKNQIITKLHKCNLIILKVKIHINTLNFNMLKEIV